MKKSLWSVTLLTLLVLTLCLALVGCNFGERTGEECSEGLLYAVNDDKMTCAVTGIGTCADSDVIIPSEIDGYAVTSISYAAFSGCEGLNSITIPDSVMSIGEYAFSGSGSLTSINVGKNNPNYSSENGILYDKSMKAIISAPGGISGKIIIPDSVTCIGSYAFSGCNRLESITIPDSVSRISSSAFSGCTGLVQISDGVSYVDKWVIDCDKDKTAVTIRKNTVGIADSAFFGCDSLESVTIPSSVAYIGECAFYKCESLANIRIPESVAVIGNSVFLGCKNLKNITIPDGVTCIGGSAFAGCDNLAHVTIPDSVTNIGEWAFSDCGSLEQITIPSGVTYIGSKAFFGCDSLTSITLSDSVANIGSEALFYCSKLTDVYYMGKKEQWDSVRGNNELKGSEIHYNFRQEG